MVNNQHRNIQIIKIHEGIKKLIEKEKYKEAERYLSEYLSESLERNNSYLYLQLVTVLRKNHKYEEAFSIAIDNIYSKNRRYFLNEIVILYIIKRDYINAYKYFNILEKEEFNFGSKIEKYMTIKYFLAQKLFKIDPVKYYYLENESLKEVVCFNNMIKHVLERHSYENHDKDTTYFDKQINVINLLKHLKSRIENDCLIYEIDAICNYYYFKNNDSYIGYTENNNKCEYIKVVTSLDNQILTAFPINKIDKKRTNLLYKHDEPIKIKEIKRISQIDKFNKKYRDV